MLRPENHKETILKTKHLSCWSNSLSVHADCLQNNAGHFSRCSLVYVLYKKKIEFATLCVYLIFIYIDFM